MSITRAIVLTGLVSGLLASPTFAADLMTRTAESGRFSTLIQAMETAGLVETVAKRGPFTLFAPTDEAFAKLPDGELNQLLKDKPRLQSVLSYHLVPGRIKLESVSGQSVRTIQGQSLQVTGDTEVTVGKARVLESDIEADNGVIHVIDTVILPR